MTKDLHTDRIQNQPVAHCTSKSNRFVYVPVPKVACRSLIKLFNKSLPGGFDVVRSKQEYGPYFHFATPKHISNRDYFICMFIRNPYDRLVSAWVDKIENQGIGEDAYVELKGNSFEDIAHAVCRKQILRGNSHFMSQSAHIKPLKVKFDFIGKLENLNDGLDIISKRIGVNIGTPTVIGPTSHDPWESYYAGKPELISLVNKYYIDDFKRFRYRMLNPRYI